MAQKKDTKSRKWFFYGSYRQEDGSIKQYKKRGYNTKAEAKEAERLFKLSLNDNCHRQTSKTFEVVSNEYTLENNQNKISTNQSDKEILRKVNKELGDLLISKIKSTTLQKYINDLDQKYSKEYVKKIYYVMNKIFEFAIFKNYILVNPLKKVKYAKRKDIIKKEMAYWEPEEFKIFINSYEEHTMDYVFFNFLYYMGVRRGEALALSWKDIDLKESIVNIDKTVTFKIKGEPWVITSPKTNNSIRKITMPKHLNKIMYEWKENQMKMYEFNDDRFVFGYDRPYPPETLRIIFKKRVDTINKDGINLNKIRIHDFRHSHASYLINNMSAGFTDFDIAKRLGDTVQTLHSTYAHWFKQADKNIIDFMDNDIE